MQITEMDLGNTDHLEIQNVSPTPVDVTGWKVVISDSYTDINLVNAFVQTLSGTLQPVTLSLILMLRQVRTIGVIICFGTPVHFQILQDGHLY